VVLSQAAARAAWPTQNPIGRTFLRGDETMTVVGVAGNTQSRSLTDGSDPMVYAPYSDLTPFSSTGYLTVRSVKDPRTIISSIEDAIHTLDPAVPIPQVRTLPQVIRSSVALEHFEMLLLLAFGVAALALAALGIYGVLAVSVAERTRDVALRIALGADKRRILAMVAREGVAPACVGVLLGIFAGVTTAHLAQTLIPDVSSVDPLAIALTAVLLPGIALAASLLPARRAASIDPMQALRAE
jgi:ABC-type antimicrobial peptide transport system permease subunit